MKKFKNVKVEDIQELGLKIKIAERMISNIISSISNLEYSVKHIDAFINIGNKIHFQKSALERDTLSKADFDINNNIFYGNSDIDSSNVFKRINEHENLVAEMERLKHENEQLKTQISILTKANNEAYATISMIRGDKS